MVGVTEGAEVEACGGEEAFQEAGPVLHPLKPGLDQDGELGEVAFGQVGQGPFEVRPDWLSYLRHTALNASRHQLVTSAIKDL